MESASEKTSLSMCRSPLELDDENHIDAEDNNGSMESKKLRRVLASRQYSQKYRMKQLQYILELETEMKALQAEVAIKSPRIKYMDRQNSLLRVENGKMAQKVSGYFSELMFKEAQYEELKKERDVLKQNYMVMNQQVPDFLGVPPSHNFQELMNNFTEPQTKIN